MNIMFDTSLLVAAMIARHPDHDRGLPWLARARAGEFTGVICSHTLAELYAVLTSLPVSPRISTGIAHRLIEANIRSSIKIVALTSADYFQVIRQLADLTLSGGIVYDALILRAARKAGASQLVTLNPRDFQRLPADGVEIVSP